MLQRASVVGLGTGGERASIHAPIVSLSGSLALWLSGSLALLPRRTECGDARPPESTIANSNRVKPSRRPSQFHDAHRIDHSSYVDRHHECVCITRSNWLHVRRPPGAGSAENFGPHAESAGPNAEF